MITPKGQAERTTTVVVPAPELLKTKAAALKEATPLILRAQELTIEDDESYELADTIRTTIKSGIKKWTDRLELIIRPARQALDGLYELNREITGPMKGAQDVIDRKMKDYKLAEAARIREEREAAEREERRLEEEKIAAQEKAEKAKGALKKLAEAKVERIEEKVEQVRGRVSAPVAASSSGTRTVKMWEVVDLKALLGAIVRGEIPEDVVEINRVNFNDYFKGDMTPGKDMIRTWPGVEISDSVTIVSRRR